MQYAIRHSMTRTLIQITLYIYIYIYTYIQYIAWFWRVGIPIFLRRLRMYIRKPSVLYGTKTKFCICNIIHIIFYILYDIIHTTWFTVSQHVFFFGEFIIYTFWRIINESKLTKNTSYQQIYLIIQIFSKLYRWGHFKNASIYIKLKHLCKFVQIGWDEPTHIHQPVPIQQRLWND